MSSRDQASHQPETGTKKTPTHPSSELGAKPTIGNVRNTKGQHERKVGAMNEQRQRLIDEAAQRFAEALAESYEMTADPVSAQQFQTELTQNFCNAVIEKLRA